MPSRIRRIIVVLLLIAIATVDAGGCPDRDFLGCVLRLRALRVPFEKNILGVVFNVTSEARLLHTCKAYSDVMPCFRDKIIECGDDRQRRMLAEVARMLMFLCSPFSMNRQRALISHNQCIAEILNMPATTGCDVDVHPLGADLKRCRKYCSGPQTDFICMMKTWVTEQNICTLIDIENKCSIDAAEFYADIQITVFEPKFPIICDLSSVPLPSIRTTTTVSTTTTSASTQTTTTATTTRAFRTIVPSIYVTVTVAPPAPPLLQINNNSITEFYRPVNPYRPPTLLFTNSDSSLTSVTSAPPTFYRTMTTTSSPLTSTTPLFYTTKFQSQWNRRTNNTTTITTTSGKDTSSTPSLFQQLLPFPLSGLSNRISAIIDRVRSTSSIKGPNYSMSVDNEFAPIAAKEIYPLIDEIISANTTVSDRPTIMTSTPSTTTTTTINSISTTAQPSVWITNEYVTSTSSISSSSRPVVFTRQPTPTYIRRHWRPWYLGGDDKQTAKPYWPIQK